MTKQNNSDRSLGNCNRQLSNTSLCSDSNTSANSYCIDREQAIAHLALLGYQSDDFVYLRFFQPNGKGKGRKLDARFPDLPWRQIEEYQLQGMSCYVVVNGGGQRDCDVLECRAIFYEHDDLSKDTQRELWRSLKLPEPTIQIDTGGKSIHSYWGLMEPIPPGEWRILQTDLLEFAKADRSLKNPSRVMRLAGCIHTGTNQPSSIINQSGNCYCFEQIRAIIPEREIFSRKEIQLKRSPLKTIERTDLIDLLRSEIYPRLTPEEIYNWDGHHFTCDAKGKLRGNCPFHESTTGTAFWVESTKDRVTYAWACPTCTQNGKRDPISYRFMLMGGQGSPRGKAFREIVEILAEQAGICLTDIKKSKSAGQENSPCIYGDTEENFGGWQAPESCNDYLGTWKSYSEKGSDRKERRFTPKADFDFVIERELSSESGGGVVLIFKRAIDTEAKRIVLQSTDWTVATRFVDALKQSAGVGIVSNLTISEINALLHVKLREYRQNGGKIFKLVERQGKQLDGTWVFQDKQFKEDGTPTTEEQSSWVFCENLGDEDFIPSPTISDYRPTLIKQYLEVKQRFFGSNFLPSLLVDGFVIATLHDQKIMKVEKSFPLLNLYGDPGGLKTLAVELSLALAGWGHSEHGTLSKVSESMLFERLKFMGSLPTCWDDPPRDDANDDLCKRIFNRQPRVVRGNCQTPHGSLIVNSNQMMGESNAATRTRLIPIFMPVVTDIDKGAWKDLNGIREKVSGAFPDFLAIGYPKDKVDALENELLQYLPMAHARTAKSLALVTFYAGELVRLAGCCVNIKQWVIDHLCSDLNASQSGLDCISNFVVNLTALESSNQVGEWSKIQVETKHHGTCIALHMPELWRVFDRQFEPAYSKGTLERVLESRGAIKGTSQKFWHDRDQTMVYHRARVQGRNKGENYEDPTEPVKIGRKCLLVPLAIWDSFTPCNIGNSDETLVTSEIFGNPG